MLLRLSNQTCIYLNNGIEREGEILLGESLIEKSSDRVETELEVGEFCRFVTEYEFVENKPDAKKVSLKLSERVDEESLGRVP